MTHTYWALYSKQLCTRFLCAGMVPGTRSTLEWLKNKIQKPCRKIQPSKPQRAGEGVWLPSREAAVPAHST